MANNYIQEFDSIQKLYKYLCDTPINKVFKLKDHSSIKGSYEFTQTHSFEEATNLLKNGWDDMSKELTQKLNTACKKLHPMKAQRDVLSVAGYQPIIALYLAGVPQNMISKQMVVKKQKIVELTKSVSYGANVKKEVIVEESIKAMMIVKKLEVQGFRIKLNIVLGTNADNRNIICKVCIKQPNERLNVSKLAFPMIHPSMLRRLFLRYIEVNPDVTSGFGYTYGHPIYAEALQHFFSNEVVLPAIFDGSIENVDNIDKLKAIL